MDALMDKGADDGFFAGAFKDAVNFFTVFEPFICILHDLILGSLREGLLQR
jgi:hypothetical protein